MAGPTCGRSPPPRRAALAAVARPCRRPLRPRSGRRSVTMTSVRLCVAPPAPEVPPPHRPVDDDFPPSQRRRRRGGPPATGTARAGPSSATGPRSTTTGRPEAGRRVAHGSRTTASTRSLRDAGRGERVTRRTQGRGRDIAEVRPDACVDRTSPTRFSLEGAAWRRRVERSARRVRRPAPSAAGGARRRAGVGRGHQREECRAPGDVAGPLVQVGQRVGHPQVVLRRRFVGLRCAQEAMASARRPGRPGTRRRRCGPPPPGRRAGEPRAAPPRARRPWRAPERPVAVGQHRVLLGGAGRAAGSLELADGQPSSGRGGST